MRFDIRYDDTKILITTPSPIPKSLIHHCSPIRLPKECEGPQPRATYVEAASDRMMRNTRSDLSVPSHSPAQRYTAFLGSWIIVATSEWQNKAKQSLK
ncbi:hypothetical protein AVEN_136277-1 [Araneus ventricosus]|uniref:Uncharacterized protein n=1 Tax=Araneus ventricosus TaxID=182803 RepID=A0A4Y2SRW6_ARAVE|nr:hypothetical protein AVEN_136277-1 [Araneus ventricosus]